MLSFEKEKLLCMNQRRHMENIHLLKIGRCPLEDPWEVIQLLTTDGCGLDIQFLWFKGACKEL